MPDADEETTIDFGKKKKKKKDQGEKAVEKTYDANFEYGPRYEYGDLLKRLHAVIEENNAELLADKKRYKMVPPQVVRVGSKKVGWVNFKQIAELMDRDQTHIFQFFLAEFGTEGSLAGKTGKEGSGQMILKGRFTAKHIESLLKKYIVEYVTCSMCKSPNTTLTKDNNTRLSTISCKSCGASRTVAAIKAGYHATTKTDRRKAKFAKIT